MSQTAKIKMIKKDPCPYCDRAMNLFNRKGYVVEVIDLTKNTDEILTWKEKTGWQTFPMIFINDIMIGGYNDLKALDEEGRLDDIVQKLP